MSQSGALTESWTPGWAKETVPAWVVPFCGRPGLGKPWTDVDAPLGRTVAGIDFWHANHFVVCRQETSAYLYSDYTALRVDYREGTFPTIERAVAHLRGQPTSMSLAIKVLTHVLPEVVKHPTVPPCGRWMPPSRGTDDEGLALSGIAWCNEQSRVFVRLCQVLGIPARMIFLFFANGKTGHVSSEFYADGKWVHADPSWFCVFPDAAGVPMSALECHTDVGKPLAAKAIAERINLLQSLSDEALGVQFQPNARGSLVEWANYLGNLLDRFGVMNYPLPHE
jgi:hypothetical protein